MDPSELGSVVLYKNGKLYTRSTAALLIAKELSGAWPLLAAFIVVPPVIRNGVYNFVAANRYKWFGKKTECWLPSAEMRERFQV